MQSFSESLLEAFKLLATFDGDLQEIILLSLHVSLTAVVFASLIGLPAGAWLATTESRLRPYLVTLVTALMGLPPVVVGLVVYLLLSNAGVLGPLQLLYPPTAMIIAQTILIVPILVALTRQTIHGLYKQHRQQLSLFCVGTTGLIKTLLWEGRHGLMTALLAGFGRAIAEVGAVIIVGGNIKCGCAITGIVFNSKRGALVKMSGDSSQVRPIRARGLLIERQNRVLLDIPALQLGTAKCSAIVGPNGAGKSLLVKALSALSPADSGHVIWGETPPDRHRRFKVGLLLQRPVLLNRSAMSNVIYALQAKGMKRSSAKDSAFAALESAGLGAMANVSAERLSGGEQQRLALARALALKPDMLFLDEATANVDPASTLVIEQQLGQAIKGGLGVVFVSHDMGQVKRLADEVILMHQAQVVEQSSSTDFFEHTINPITLSWLAGEILV